MQSTETDLFYFDELVDKNFVPNKHADLPYSSRHRKRRFSAKSRRKIPPGNWPITWTKAQKFLASKQIFEPARPFYQAI